VRRDPLPRQNELSFWRGVFAPIEANLFAQHALHRHSKTDKTHAHYACTQSANLRM
jgi:hypothetical protein